MPEVKLNGKRKAENGKLFFESAERNGIRSFHSLNGKPTKLLFYAIQHSARVRVPLRAQPRMSLNAIKLKVFRFPFSVLIPLAWAFLPCGSEKCK